MEFYLNQKSLPMIRKCGNCKFYNDRYMSCRLLSLVSAYDHTKEINVETGDNLYCKSHEFKNERILNIEANRVELKDVKEAMEVINNAKSIKVNKYNYYDNDLYNE